MIANVDELRATLRDANPPELSPLLRALWLAARGDWGGAHAIAQDVDTRDGARVHAYLHRVEGDAGNAAYWYRRAGRPVPTSDLAGEWTTLAESLLTASSR